MNSQELAQRAADAYAEILNRTRPEHHWVGVLKAQELNEAEEGEGNDEV